ncbi:MAG: hypothetical protein HKO59_07215 [Phycisphaerales bacterium]|nr:hypothetical protein [Phycisphaerae bacterium]NNM25764.1 hypothetical protein [Phycisphaerales bacterium]
MSVLAVELNDAGLYVARADAEDFPAGERGSPGVAWVRDGSLVTGLDAQRHARLHSREIHDDFWDRLDTDPVDPRHPRGPNRAEVACAHLEAILAAAGRDDATVVIAVPPFYGPRPLGLLAGIARDLGIPLPALVASPIAVDTRPIGRDRTLLVELTLHRCLISLVEGDATVEVMETAECADAGLLAFRRRWFTAIGGAFVRSTRFDPRHDAASEQRLDDRLAATVDAAVRDGRCELELAGPAGPQRTTIDAELLVSAGHDLAFRVAREVQTLVARREPAAIALNHEATRVPGLATSIKQHVPLPVTVLPPGAAATGLARMWPDAFEATAAGTTAHFTRRLAFTRDAAVAPGTTPP